MQETNKDVSTVVLLKMYCLVLYVNLAKIHSNINQSSGNLLTRKSNIQREEIHLTKF